MNGQSLHRKLPTTAHECTFTLKLQSVSSSIQQVEPFLNSIGNYCTLPKEQKHTVLVLITESVNNAIIHGNKLQEHLYASLGIEFISESSLLCIIEDEGSGFEISSIPNPTLPENLLLEGGRGLYIIEHLANNVQYIRMDKGMRITITVQW